jgi:D-alanine-D-alanine ligase
MADGRQTAALVFGGRSAEHEVSLRSARSVFDAMQRDDREIVPIRITPEGAWFRMPAEATSFEPDAQVQLGQTVIASADPQHRGFLVLNGDGRPIPLKVDVVVPILHGTYGEDGTLQGLLELADVPYVGCGVLGSAVGMDKVLMKAAFRTASLEVGPFFWFLRRDWREHKQELIERAARRQDLFPLFVKPANLGSSVGISQVREIGQLETAVDLAASYDRKILVEDHIKGRELEVSVLGNDDPKASIAGEIVSHSDFYDFEEKYYKDTAELHIPADLTQDEHARAGEVAIRAFKAIDGAGMGRVDMFLTPDGRFVVNEINTIPGFTSISMYPKLWEATGLPYAELIDRLIELAIERHTDKKQTRTDR